MFVAVTAAAALAKAGAKLCVTPPSVFNPLVSAVLRLSKSGRHLQKGVDCQVKMSAGSADEGEVHSASAGARVRGEQSLDEKQRSLQVLDAPQQRNTLFSETVAKR